MTASHAEGSIARFAGWVAAHRRAVFLIWALLVLAAVPLAVTLAGSLSGAGWDAGGSTSEEVRRELRAEFPAFNGEAAIVVYQQQSPLVADPAGLTLLLDALGASVGADNVTDPIAAPLEAGLISADGLTAMVPVRLVAQHDAELPEQAGRLIEIVDAVQLPAGATAEVTGEWAIWSDFNQMNEEALQKAELLSGLPSMILLVLVFGSLLAAGLPLILALAGIAIAFGALHLLGTVTPLSVWAMNFSMMIGLAVGIDYSLFIVSRYREERWQGRSPVEAMTTTLSTAGLAVLLSALSVILSLAAVFLVPVMVFRSMALGMMLSVTAVAAAALTLLPAILVAMGDRVLVTRGKPREATDGQRTPGRWTALALRRPGRSLLAGIVLLLALGPPTLGMRLGMPGAEVVEQGRSSRDGSDLLVLAFGAGSTAPLYVTVMSREAELLLSEARSAANVLSARVVTPPNAADRVVVQVVPRDGIESQATMDLVSDLRASLSTIAPSASVGGPAAQNHDLTASLIGRAPFAIGLITAVAFLLLLIVFRSLVIAAVSIVLDLLSVVAAFGFATLVFQHGFGAGLLGIEPQGFVNAWAPLFFFALLFGLSMDYQLFLLAAIRERYEETKNTRLAVSDGIARTGKPITNAAAIMIVVFIAFGVTGPIPPTELGITLAFAVLLDATVVRMLLVPAIMGMLGERNWWLPKWLDRRLPRINFSH
jgi:putative drug exporter of the RND superfamily